MPEHVPVSIRLCLSTIVRLCLFENHTYTELCAIPRAACLMRPHTCTSANYMPHWLASLLCTAFVNARSGASTHQIRALTPQSTQRVIAALQHGESLEALLPCWPCCTFNTFLLCIIFCIYFLCALSKRSVIWRCSSVGGVDSRGVGGQQSAGAAWQLL